MRRAAAAALLAALAAAAAPPGAGAAPAGTRVQTYARGLSFPVDMAWVAGTRRVFFTEKATGKVRVLRSGRLVRRACVDLGVRSDGERGALGIALHPHFRRNGFLYVYYTNRSPLENRVTRFRVVRNRCIRPRHIVRGIDSVSGYHNGGQLLFVRGHLFVSTGEGHDAGDAQRRGNRLGKILRLNPDGSIPADNPFRRNGRPTPVWSYGHRNVFGLARRPGTTVLVATENGPNCDDELNRIRRGRNYGWGDGYRCGTAGVGRRPKAPLLRWNPTIAPTDPWWYRGRMESLSGSLFVGDFNTGSLRRIRLTADGGRVRSSRVIHDAADGVLDVSKGPRGWLYFVTPTAIHRIVPR